MKSSGLTFSAVFQPTALFSLKDSNSTNSGAKSMFLPSPYSIKMAILNQAITLDGIDFETGKGKNQWFKIVRDTDIEYSITGSYCVNNCFIKILKPSRSVSGEIQKTVSFREYIHINEPIEIIFTVQDENQKLFLQKYLHKINYFGKRGCFFQFLEYKNNPNLSNVQNFDAKNITNGLLQKYDDFDEKFTFESVNNYGGKSSVKRKGKVLTIPLIRVASSKSYTHYKVTSTPKSTLF